MKYTKEEWLEKGKKLFGVEVENWKFVCPACGKISSGRDFKDAGGRPDDMYFKCIGRINGKGETPVKDDENSRKKFPKELQRQKEYGCNWTAGGLFRTLGKGNTVVLKSGKEMEVFDFGIIPLSEE